MSYERVAQTARWSGRAADRRTTATGCVRPAARRQVVSQNNAKPSRAAYDGQGRPGANGQGTEAGGAKGGAFTLDNTTTGAEALPRHTESPTSDA